MRILIVAAHFPPENSVAARRPASWARYLAEHGHDVSVLTTATSDISSGEPFERLTVAPPGQQHFRRADALSVLSAEGDIDWSMAPRRSAAGLLHWLRRKRGVLGSARMPDHHDLWVPAALGRLRGRRWDVVLSTHGPYACHVVAWWLRRGGRAERWIADFRDLWSDNHIFPGLPPFSWIEPSVERLLLRRADALTTVSEGLANRLGVRHRRVVHVVRNGIDLEDLRSLDARSPWPDDGLFRVVYTGTIYDSGQDPTPLFQAVRRMLDAGEPGIDRLRLVFAGKFLARLEQRLSESGLGHITQRRGFVSREESLRMQRDAGALLFLPFVSPSQDGILTGKLFEYIASGTPILSVGSARDPSTASLIEESGHGCDHGADTESITAALRRLLAAPSGPRTVDPDTLSRIDRNTSNATLLALIEGR